ncbi:MAG: VanZ family protein [Candidatus Didemnitutus sp.]|nr:VanZ family protein [Candidatus Didemnitutus sp.]
MNPSLLKESPEGHWRAIWPILLAATIFMASSQAVPPALMGIMWKADKFVHFFIYGVMALLIARLRFVQARAPWGAMAAIVIVAVFGITDEIHQAFTPGRFCDFGDWLADVLGAVTFVTAYVHWNAGRRWLEHRVVVRDGFRFRVVFPPFPLPRLS